MSGNPFLGAQPYRSGDRHHFFGREEVTQTLANHVLAHPCVTLFGESGAGKSSLMQAGVIPYLEEAHGFRTVRIDGWFAGEDALGRLVQALFTDLGLGLPPETLEASESVDLAVDLAREQSHRPVLIYLDQLEQLFLPGRSTQQVGALLDSLEMLARKPIRGLQLVLSLREDYLGRFRERARDQRLLLEQGFRLGPLTVGEMARVACRLAAAGEPEQQWSEGKLRELMIQVRAAGQEPTEHAEVQAAFAQIVCRALWEEWTRHAATGPVKAEPMLHQYLEATLEGLGAWKGHAQRLLEEHLIDSDGSRMLLMEPSARKVLSGLTNEEASRVIRHLEDAAVLHAKEHQGSRYFELGHDWLARKVFELRQERARQEQEAKLLRLTEELSRSLDARNREFIIMQARLMQESHVRMLSSIVHGVVHEISNPLGFLVANLGYLRSTLAQELSRLDFEEVQDLRAACAESVDVADLIRSVIQDMRQFILNDGRGSAPVDIRESIESALSVTRHLLDTKVQVVRDLQAVPPVYASAQHLQQLFCILIENAAQALQKGSLPPRLRIATRLQEDGRIAVDIQDSGEVIPSNELDSIFAPFFRTKRSSSGRLGLGLCKYIVESMGGHIHVDTSPDQGTTFRIVLFRAFEGPPPSIPPRES